MFVCKRGGTPCSHAQPASKYSLPTRKARPAQASPGPAADLPSSQSDIMMELSVTSVLRTP